MKATLYFTWRVVEIVVYKGIPQKIRQLEDLRQLGQFGSASKRCRGNCKQYIP